MCVVATSPLSPTGETLYKGVILSLAKVEKTTNLDQFSTKYPGLGKTASLST